MKFNNKTLFILISVVILSHCGVIANQQGNFTQAQIALIENIIQAGQDFHGPDDLDGLAALIAEYMNKSFKRCWSIYVYDENTINGTFSAHIQDQKWLKWLNYGKYKLSYLITKDTSTYNNTKIGSQDPLTGESFGHDIQAKQKDYIFQLLTESSIFKGADMDLNAQYIRSKIYPGNWNVYITSGSKKFGGNQCRRGQLWGRIQQFGRFKWNYYISRSY